MGVREEKKTRVGEISTIWEKGARVKREKLPFDWEQREKLLSKRKTMLMQLEIKNKPGNHMNNNSACNFTTETVFLKNQY